MKDAPGKAAEEPVLVVDLDGTLCCTDTLHEALAGVIAARPADLPGLASRAFGDKAAFKRAVADRAIADVETLPYNEAVLDLVRDAREQGRRTALVSASDQRQVRAIADHLGLFDDAFGTAPDNAGGLNLSGQVKADFLAERFGHAGFDYVADARVDLPVWSRARRAVSVGAEAGLRADIEGIAEETEHLDAPTDPAARKKALIKALRPHQWVKNLLVFLPVLAAHDMGGLLPAIAAFVAFSLTASSVYVVNDILDLSADRAHPRKRERPFAKGTLTVRDGALLAPILAVAGLLVALLFAPLVFTGVLLLYYVFTFAYSLTLKRRLIVDVLTLAGLYTLRILGGAAAASVMLSPWMLGFSMFLFLSLAAVKRQAELTDLAARGNTRTSGRAYEVGDLPVIRSMALSAGYASVMVLALYISSDDVQALYGRPEALWFMCAVLLYWVTRIVMKTHRGEMTDDPIVFAATDRVSQIVFLTCVAVVVAAALW